MTPHRFMSTNIPAGVRQGLRHWFERTLSRPEPLRVLHAQKARQKARASALNSKPAPTPRHTA